MTTDSTSRRTLASLMLAAAQTADTWFETSLGSAEQALGLLSGRGNDIQWFQNRISFLMRF